MQDRTLLFLQQTTLPGLEHFNDPSLTIATSRKVLEGRWRLFTIKWQ
ncbi:hypothetical protein ALC56_06622 [Trachymyrmex septentrionalis]|uniref:Uncharacterized protein n=1 Tax=Trachymyrmex septentrionalis TaxID=34720 RepID=A0A195FFR9_9HYME|nr:hypothetical protein ALC56_06622 [Trachymyrmex septentrionalis]